MPTITKPTSKYSLRNSFTVILLFVVFMSKLISLVKEFCLMSATGTLLFHFTKSLLEKLRRTRNFGKVVYSKMQFVLFIT